jgi:hypothetical protein
MIRRLKSDLVDADGKPLYARRTLQALEVAYTAEEREIHEAERLLRQPREGRRRCGSAFGTPSSISLLKKRLLLVARRVRFHAREARRHPVEARPRSRTRWPSASCARPS